jgi:hypothetical protein
LPPEGRAVTKRSQIDDPAGVKVAAGRSRGNMAAAPSSSLEGGGRASISTPSDAKVRVPVETELKVAPEPDPRFDGTAGHSQPV